MTTTKAPLGCFESTRFSRKCNGLACGLGCLLGLFHNGLGRLGGGHRFLQTYHFGPEESFCLGLGMDDLHSKCILVDGPPGQRVHFHSTREINDVLARVVKLVNVVVGAHAGLGEPHSAIVFWVCCFPASHFPE